MLLDDELRPSVLQELKFDYETYYMLEQVGQAWSKQWVSRSLLQRMTVKQIGLAFHLEKWVWTPRLASLVKNRQTRIIGQHIVEDSFNTLKAGVGLGSNSRCSQDRAWAIPIDRGLISSVHWFAEVDRTKIHHARNAAIEVVDGWVLPSASAAFL